MDVTGTPPLTRADAVLQAGEELLQEFGDPQELRIAIREAVEAANGRSVRAIREGLGAAPR